MTEPVMPPVLLVPPPVAMLLLFGMPPLPPLAMLLRDELGIAELDELPPLPRGGSKQLPVPMSQRRSPLQCWSLKQPLSTKLLSLHAAMSRSRAAALSHSAACDARVSLKTIVFSLHLQFISDN
jgi:hypothetical protein